MKKYILFLFLLPGISLAQWVQTNGPYGGIITNMVSLNDNVFAGTVASGVFLSMDNGLNWTSTNNGLNKKYIGEFIALDTLVFAATLGGVFFTSDNGQNWIEVNNGLPEYKAVYCFTVLGTDIYAGTSKGVYRTTNYGKDWLLTGLQNYSIYSLTAAGTNIFAGIYNSVYISNDNGNNWTAINNGLPNQNFIPKCFGVSGSIVYTGTHLGVYRTTNYGVSWSHQGLTNYFINSFIGIENNFYAATDYGIYLTTDNGVNWNAMNTGLKNTLVWSFTSLGSNLFTGTSGGVYVSSNGGQNWMAVNNGLNISAPCCFISTGSNIFAGTKGTGVFLSTDNGGSWSELNNGLGTSFIYSLIQVDTDMFAGTLDNGVFRSTNNGLYWYPANAGIAQSSVYSFTISGIYIFAASYGVFSTSDKGENWIEVSNGLTDKNVRSLAALDTKIFAGTLHGLFISNDNGASWNRANQVNSNYINSLAVKDSDIFAGTESGNGIWRSTNKGINWTEVDTLIAPKCFAVYKNYIFASAADGEIYLSENNGTSWFLVNEGLPEIDILSISVLGSNIFAGTDGMGVWKRPLSEITSVEYDEELPNEYLLYQNYPNPFNPITKIKFSLPYLTIVNLIVFDILGNEVEILIDEEKPAGSYEVKWGAADLSSGIYFYRLRAGSYIETKKMVLVR